PPKRPVPGPETSTTCSFWDPEPVLGSVAGADEVHGLRAGGHVLSEEATDGGGHGRRAGLADAAHRHAQVLGLDDDEHASWPERPLDLVSDLRREPLL